MDAIKPKYLFKFVDIATAKKIIENNSLMFSHPSTFNDPFDCNIHQLYFDFNECCDAVAKDVRAIQNQHPGRHISDEIKIAGLRGAQEDKIARCAVTCFSLNHYNTLLWSYYADKHFGA